MSRSSELFAEAKKIIPGGVNSPVRAFKGVGGDPLFFKRGEGAYLYDADENSYIDYVGSWGPLILGHCHPRVLKAVSLVLDHGMTFGAPTELEIKLAAKVCDLMPSIEMIRMVNSGTEATMTAIRLARAYTRRNKFIKFNGCYHGHSDSLLVKAGSGLLTLGIPSTPGIPNSVTEHTLTADFNNIEQTNHLFQQYPEDIAAIILEPIAGNMGFIKPDSHFLQELRYLCDKHNTVLIFDEVMTGFRVGLQGAQGLYNISPDLTTLGKVIGGGMPVGALGGKRSIMSCLAPEGDVYQAGTLSGNPLAMAAGLATLEAISEPGFFESLSVSSQYLMNALQESADSHGLSFRTDYEGGMFGFNFTDLKHVRNYADVAQSNYPLFKSFYQGMLSEGIYFAPSMYEAGFLSAVHSKSDLDKTCEAANKVMSRLKKTAQF